MNHRKLFTLILAAAAATTAQAQSQLYPQHFDLEEVTLLEGPMQTAMVTNARLLLDYDHYRLLTPFIRQAGLFNTTDPQSPYYQWEQKHPSFRNWALRDWSLEGHVGGHYISALALAYAGLNDHVNAVNPNAALRDTLMARLNYCLQVMKDCQDAYQSNTEGLQGFIGGQPINQIWTGLYSGSYAEFSKFGGWVPFYCQHKILAGLRDAYLYTGSELAKEMFRNLSDWSVNVASKLSDEDFERHVLRWEHGGMNETLADAYQMFGDIKYLEAAKRYSHKAFLNGMQNGHKPNFLDGKHANTQVPKYIGFERIYQLADSLGNYRDAARNFWTNVSDERTVCIGGNSVDEHFMAANAAGRYISNLNGPESCNSNNMLKLSEDLFDDTHDARYADFYESTMWNHILSTQDPATGGYVYFTTLRPQGYRIYSQVNQGMWCCVGTGMENHSKYGHFIYTHSADTLFVNLFTASQLDNERFGIRQDTRFPYEQATHLTITKPGKFVVAVRRPSWTGQGPAAYTYYDRTWSAGDTLSISLPMSMRYETCPNLPDYVAFKYGPILLAAKTTAASANPDADETAFGLKHEVLQNEYARDGRMDHAPGSMASTFELTQSPLLICERDTLLRRIKERDLSKLQFVIDAKSDKSQGGWKQLMLEPFYSIHHARYMAYWYQQNEAGYATSDMAKSEAEAAALAARTIDEVGTGEQQSEAGHQASYSPGSTSGYYNGETYRDAQRGGFVQYVLSTSGIKKKDKASIMCRFITHDSGRIGTLYVDNTAIGEITVQRRVANANIKGFYNVEFEIPAELLRKKKEITVRLQASDKTLMPGLYYMRLLKAE